MSEETDVTIQESDQSIEKEIEEQEQEVNEEQQEEEDQQEKESEPVKHDAQSRIRQLVNEKAELKAQLERATAPPPQENLKPDPADYVGGVFNPDYIEDLTDFKMTEAIHKRDFQQSTEKRINAVRDREAEFIKANPDYHNALDIVTGSNLINDGLIYEAIIDDEHAPEIVFFLGNNPKVLAQIERMSPAQKIMKLGAISASFDKEMVKPQAQVSRAAKPVSPISGGSVPLTKAAQIAAAEKSGDYDAWKAAMRS
jgi:hypothetical protein